MPSNARPRLCAGVTFVGLTAHGMCLGFEAKAMSNAVQPAGDRAELADGSGLAGQHKKRGLKNVLRSMVTVQDSPANAKNHRAMAANQGGKRGLVSAFGESSQAVGVGVPGGLFSSRQRTDVLQKDTGGWSGHRGKPPSNRHGLPV
jgi:hypothetical protein